MLTLLKTYLNSFLLTVILLFVLCGSFFFASTQLVILSDNIEQDRFVRDMVTQYESAQNAKEKITKEKEKEINCLAMNIYYEAGNESMEGKLAVAQVTMNRTHNKGYPTTICGVVYQNTLYDDGTRVYQFSWVGEHHKPGEMNPYNWKEARWIAREALTNGVAHDTLAKHNVLFYHAAYVHPGWTNVREYTTIGHHIFYVSLII